MSYRTTPTGRHRRGWDEERQKEGTRSGIEKEEFTIYD
jgi:hypothetical protein